MKKLVAAALMLTMMASLASCGKSTNAADAEYIYGKIDSVSGNDVVLLLADYNENADENSAEETDEESSKSKRSEKSDGEKSKKFSKPEDGEMPEGFDPSKFGGEKPEGFSKPEDGEMPEGFDPSKFSGEKPEGFSKPEDGEMPEGFDPSKFGGERPEGSGKSKDDKKSDSKKTDKNRPNSKYTLTGEQEELRIPVGTTVTTVLGVKTDFDALSAGNIIKCSVEKNSDGQDIVTEVWIMEE
jgi:hypothetical protein